jgi:hypothetical protein
MSLSFDSTGRRRPGAFVPDTMRWTLDQINRAKVLRREGFTLATVAGMLTEEFGILRTREAVSGMFKSLEKRCPDDIAPRNRAEASRAAAARVKAERMERAANLSRRPCLCCRDLFVSEGPGNRICAPCKSTEAWR